MSDEAPPFEPPFRLKSDPATFEGSGVLHVESDEGVSWLFVFNLDGSCDVVFGSDVFERIELLHTDPGILTLRPVR